MNDNKTEFNIYELQQKAYFSRFTLLEHGDIKLVVNGLGDYYICWGRWNNPWEQWVGVDLDCAFLHFRKKVDEQKRRELDRGE